MRRIDGLRGGDRIITRTCFGFHPGMVPNEATLKRTAQPLKWTPVKRTIAL